MPCSFVLFSEDSASLGLILIMSTMASFCYLTSTMASFDLSCRCHSQIVSDQIVDQRERNGPCENNMN